VRDYVPHTTRLLSIVLLTLWAPLAAAQSKLGELLDAGANKMSLEDFRRELVQRALVGPSPVHGNLEMMYTTSYKISGRATFMAFAHVATGFDLEGEWSIGDNGSICSSMAINKTTLPKSCQYWFKRGDTYYLADSDIDRQARVLPRTIKR